MKELFRKLIFVLIALVLFLAFKASHGEEVKFNCNAPRQVSVGDQFQVTFSINVAGTGFRGPSFKGFTVLAGPSQSSSSNIQIINGQMTQSISYTYTYYLQADKEGTFQVDAATINVQGSPVKTNPFNIQVVKGNVPSQGRQGQGGTQKQGSAAIGPEDLFVKTIVNKTEVYQGEQIVVTQKIYSRVSLVGFQDIKYPAYNGFWASEVKMPSQVDLKRETYNGTAYNVAELKKTIIFPQKSGTLTIEPATVTAVVQVRVQNKRRTGDPFFDNFFNDPFFSGGVQNVPKEVRSAPVTIRVKPLPENGKPADFNGAVGSYSIKATTDKTDVKANEAITLKVTVSGNGNLELIDKLNTDFPSDFEVYDPKTSNNISSTAAGVSGSRTFEYLMIPRNPGKYTIKPVTFSFFDLSKRQYVSLSTTEFGISVQKGDGSGTVTYTGVDKEELKLLGSDIRFIQTGRFALRPAGKMFFGTSLYWLLFLLLFLLFATTMVIWRRHVKLSGDAGRMKNLKATKVARKRMKKAHQFLQARDEDGFYIEASQALWGYLSDKLNIPRASLSIDTVKESMQRKQAGEAFIAQYLSTLEECEYARFAPGTAEDRMDGFYNKTVELVSQAEKELK